MARPKKYDLDTDQVEKLAGFGCTNTEIASFLGVVKTLLGVVMANFLQKVERRVKYD